MLVVMVQNTLPKALVKNKFVYLNQMWRVIKKYRDIIYMAALVVAMLLLAKACGDNRADKQRLEDLVSYEHIAKKYVAKDGTLINFNNSLTVTPEDLKIVQDSLLGYIENLKLKIKDVHSTTIITERLILDTLEVPVYLSNCKFDTTIQLENPNYNMDITMTNEGLTFNKLEFPNRSGFTMTDKREKWWKAKESIVTVTNSNPLMQTEGITSYTFKQNQKWWQKRWVHAIGGVAIGSIATYKILK